MKVLLTTLNSKYIHMNLAIRLLYELNSPQHPELAWHEFTIHEEPNEVANYCSQFEVVAFSCYIWNITQTLHVADLIRAQYPQVKILLGGPEVSYEWQEVIQQQSIDFIITGEGEIPFREFLNSYPKLDLVPNLIRKIGDEIRYQPAEVNFDVKEYASINPYRHDSEKELYNKVSYIETSRGCPYKCEFCLASLDNKVRYLPIDRIKENLLYLMRHGRVIKFLDRTFNVKRDFTIDIFQFILQHRRPENIFQFEITADILHADIMRFIDEHVPPGVFRFEIGIQTVNQKANLEVSRKQNFYKTSEVIKRLEHKIEMHLDLIVGLPLDEWDDTKFSFEEVFKLYPPELQLGFLKFLKGTPVREKYEQHGYVFDPNPPYQIIESNYLSKEQLADIVRLENALEIYWNRKRSINTLKYITSTSSVFDFLLGLGKAFELASDFHKHSIDDVFNILNNYIQLHFPNDKVLHEIMAIDYYLFHKIRPADAYLMELPRDEKFILLNASKLSHQKFRFAVLPITFDFVTFQQHGTLVEKNDNLIIQYTGREKPTIVNVLPAE